MALFIGCVIHSCRIHIKLCVFPILRNLSTDLTQQSAVAHSWILKMDHETISCDQWILSHWLGTSEHTSIEMTIDDIRCFCISQWNVREWLSFQITWFNAMTTDCHSAFCLLFLGFIILTTTAESLNTRHTRKAAQLISEGWIRAENHVYFILWFFYMRRHYFTSNGIFYWHFRSDISLLIN